MDQEGSLMSVREDLKDDVHFERVVKNTKESSMWSRRLNERCTIRWLTRR